MVAFQDGELSPGSSARVGEHLVVCPPCREIETRLRGATPEVGPGLPLDMRRVAWDRIDRALDAARAHTPIPPAFRLGLSSRVPLPIGAVMGYATILVLALSWGAANWWEAVRLRAEVDVRRAVVEAPASDVPADHIRPASWTPAPVAP